MSAIYEVKKSGKDNISAILVEYQKLFPEYIDEKRLRELKEYFLRKESDSTIEILKVKIMQVSGTEEEIKKAMANDKMRPVTPLELLLCAKQNPELYERCRRSSGQKDFRLLTLLDEEDQEFLPSLAPTQSDIGLIPLPHWKGVRFNNDLLLVVIES